uniref:Transmembrane protein n=1 Tax=Cacopsylla melanoneura TaxID=428564 RepID=A0A8D8LMQ4_9HEMI
MNFEKSISNVFFTLHVKLFKFRAPHIFCYCKFFERLKKTLFFLQLCLSIFQSIVSFSFQLSPSLFIIFFPLCPKTLRVPLLGLQFHQNTKNLPILFSDRNFVWQMYTALSTLVFCMLCCFQKHSE